MNWKKVLWLVIPLLVTAALIAPQPLAWAASPQSGGHFVRLEVAASAAFNRLGLQPRADLNYGSFRWLELTEADFAILSASGLAYTPAVDGGSVQVMGYRFDPRLDGEPALPRALRANGDGAGLYLVQMAGPVQDAWLSQFAAAGMDVLQYYPSNTYLVWGTPAQAQGVAAKDFVRWQGAFHPAYKLSPALYASNGRIENVAITFYNDGYASATLEQITALGGGYVQHFAAQPDGRFITAIFSLDASALEAVARLSPVWAIEYSSPRPGIDDEVGAQIIAGNTPGGTPVTGYYDWLAAKGVDGTGITWADVDTGLDSGHPDITGRAVAYVDYGSPADTDADGHGSHTAGAIFGDPRDGTGILDPNGFYWGAGAAPSASLVVQNGLMGPWPPTGGWQVFSQDSVVNGAIGSSNSWTTGGGAGVGYTDACRTHDLMVRDANWDTPGVAEPLIMVFSAGNSGPGGSTMTEPKEAKNLITVGASMNYPRSGSNINGLASFSSRGPAVDGRILPNVTAPGDLTTSFRSSQGTGSCTNPVPGEGGSYYSWCGGTSMAAPFVSGASALIADWWNQEYGVDPSPAMVKALLINGGTDMFGGENIGGHIPNNNQGWGRVTLNNVIRNPFANIYHDQDTVFYNTGETWTLSFGVLDPTQPLKITLVWADAAGAVGANPALVNDLDLTVVNGDNTYRGNNFTDGWSTPGGIADSLNNIENVFIQNPEGNATITIQATGINGDGVPYNGDATDQDFAIVCTNCILQPDFTLAVTPRQQSICAPNAAVYAVQLGQIWTFDQPVTLSAPNLPAGLTAVFDPNPVTAPATAVFSVTNTISATAGMYNFSVQGSAITLTHAVTVGLELYTAAPGVPELLYPAAEARNIPVRPAFTWQAEQGKQYDIEIATDAAFTNLVAMGVGLEGASFTPATDLPANTVLYWHVMAHNTCGESGWSPTQRFLTEATLGQCALGATPSTLLSQDFESVEPAGWSTGGIGSTWISSLTRKHSGVRSFKGTDVDTVSDQWLISPSVVLPSGQDPVLLSFWGYRKFQPSGCFDGSVVEISQDGGATWTALDAQLRAGPYDGTIASASNPLYGQHAWCTPQTSWQNTVAALDEFAGGTVQFRFRLGTDDSIGYEGWYVDDVNVQSCTASTTLGPDSSKLAMPGESIVHTFVLSNQSTATDSFALSTTGNIWPTTIVSVNPITLTAGSTATVSVRVDVDLVFTSLSDSFELTAVSLGVPGVTAQAHGVTSLDIHPAAALSADQSGVGRRGQVVEYVFTVTNTGDYTDTYTLGASGIWLSFLPDGTTTGPVGPGQSITVTLLVAIPTDALPGATDVTVLTATSSLDSGVVASANAATAVYYSNYLPVITR